MYEPILGVLLAALTAVVLKQWGMAARGAAAERRGRQVSAVTASLWRIYILCLPFICLADMTLGLLLALPVQYPSMAAAVEGMNSVLLIEGYMVAAACGYAAITFLPLPILLKRGPSHVRPGRCHWAAWASNWSPERFPQQGEPPSAVFTTEDEEAAESYSIHLKGRRPVEMLSAALLCSGAPLLAVAMGEGRLLMICAAVVSLLGLGAVLLVSGSALYGCTLIAGRRGVAYAGMCGAPWFVPWTLITAVYYQGDHVYLLVDSSLMEYRALRLSVRVRIRNRDGLLRVSAGLLNVDAVSLSGALARERLFSRIPEGLPECEVAARRDIAIRVAGSPPISMPRRPDVLALAYPNDVDLSCAGE